MKKITFSDSEKVFYISDMHFGHGNIIRHCNRPFKDADEMDAVLINNWNSVVGKNDTVIVVGDFCFKSQPAEEYLKQLNGKKILVIGNHDKYGIRGFDGEYDLLLVKHQDRHIVCCHYPIAEWYGFYRDAYHFYGHIHNAENRAAEIMNTLPGAYNVGADVLDFTLKTADEIIKETKK